MTAFLRTDPDQPNLIDGTIYAYDVRENGAYVTVSGNNNDRPLILSFNLDDITALRDVLAYFPVLEHPGFSHYCEPSELLDDDRELVVGLGDIENDPEKKQYAYLGAGTEDHYSSVLLTKDELINLIGSLNNAIEAMETA